MSTSRILNVGDILILKESLADSCWNVEINGIKAKLFISEVYEDGEVDDTADIREDVVFALQDPNAKKLDREFSDKFTLEQCASKNESNENLDARSKSEGFGCTKLPSVSTDAKLRENIEKNITEKKLDEDSTPMNIKNLRRYHQRMLSSNFGANVPEAKLLNSIGDKLSALQEDLYGIRVEIHIIIKAINELGGDLVIPELSIESSPEQKILEKMQEHPYLPIFKDSKGQIHDSIALAPSRNIFYVELLVPNVNLGVISEDDRELLSRLDFNLFPYKESKGEEYMCIFLMLMFYEFDLLRVFKISDMVLYRFILSVSRKYRIVPFHNFYHAFNVTQTAYYMLTTAQAKRLLGPLEMMAILIAAICHDCDHPGLNNDFQRQAQTRVFHMHKKSVLENHHYLTCMSLLARPETNILINLTEEQESRMYIYLRDLILATDLAVHGLILKSLNERKKICAKFFKSGSALGMSLEDKKLMMIAIIKCSDLSNEIRKQSISRRWAKLVIAEFFSQSDKERELDFKVTPFMDKHKIIIAQEQINFIEKLCLPLYTPFSQIFPKIETCIDTMIQNRDSWQQLLKSFFTDPSELKKLSNKSIWEREQVKIKGDLYSTLAMRATKSDIPKTRRRNLVINHSGLVIDYDKPKGSGSHKE